MDVTIKDHKLLILLKSSQVKQSKGLICCADILKLNQCIINFQKKVAIMHLLYCIKPRMELYLDHLVKAWESQLLSSASFHRFRLRWVNQQAFNFTYLINHQKRFHLLIFSKANTYNMDQVNWASTVLIWQQSQRIQMWKETIIIVWIGKILWMKIKKQKFFWVMLRCIRFNFSSEDFCNNDHHEQITYKIMF